MTETINIEDNFYRQLQMLWSIESMLVKAIPKMAAKASHLGLQKNLALHLQETSQHKVAIGAIAKQLEFELQDEEDAGLKAILSEGEKAMAGIAAGNDLDAAIIEGAQKVEQYEITTYAPVAADAEALGYEGIAKRLRLTLEEENQASNKLRYMANHLIGSKQSVSLM